MYLFPYTSPKPTFRPDERQMGRTQPKKRKIQDANISRIDTMPKAPSPEVITTPHTTAGEIDNFKRDISPFTANWGPHTNASVTVLTSSISNLALIN